MGTILSSRKDYNRALARQTQKSIDIRKFEVPDNLQQYPLSRRLSIPEPLRNSQLKNSTPASPSESPHSELNQLSTQPNPSPVVDNQTPEEPPSSEKQLVRSSSYSLQPNLLSTNQTMNSDATVISRSVVNLNNHHQMNNGHFSSFRPHRSIVERNGKQFFTELNERMERRYVQVYDEMTGRMRLFEVTDYIPSRTVRPVRKNAQFQSQNAISRTPLPPRFPVNNRSTLPAISNGRTEPAVSTSLVDFRGLNNRETITREFDLYHSGAPLPPNNNNTNVSRPQRTTQRSIDSNYSLPQPKAYNTSTINSREGPNQYTSGSDHYQRPSYRQHSPTASDASVSTSTSKPTTSNDDSDSEGLDRTALPNNRRARNNTDVSYGTIAGRNSPIPFDPFKKTVSTRDPYYKKRPDVNNYAEPVSNNRSFQPSASSDYAPIPLAHKQSNSSANHYSRRRGSNTYDD